jgi:hypothetical protein
MTEDIVKSRSPIEEEIEKKRIELAQLESELADTELKHATLENELRYFERQYYKRVGTLLAELDEIKAQIAEAIAVLSPHNDNIQDEAEEAREQADKTFDEARTFSENQRIEQKPDKFTPTENIKKLFRDVAKKIHPDLAKNDADRERRSNYMKEANRAYHDGSIERLTEILKEWESNSDKEAEIISNVELKKMNRLIAQIKKRIQEIKNKNELLEKSEIGQLKAKADIAEHNGEDLLSQIALEIQAQINKKHKCILSAIRTLSQPD